MCTKDTAEGFLRRHDMFYEQQPFEDLTDAFADPDHVIPSLAELLAQLDAAKNAAKAAQDGASAATAAAGAANAALFAVAMLANQDPTLNAKLQAFRQAQTDKVLSLVLPTP